MLISGVLSATLAVGLVSARTVARARRQMVLLADENERLAREVGRDHLTGLANRREVHRALDEALARGDRPTAVLYIDVDRFKDINDRHGHPCGDRVLMALADRLIRVLPEGSCAGRVGGDELVVVLPDIESLTDATQLATTLRDELAAPLSGDDGAVGVTVSIGVATSDTGDGAQATDAAGLLERADRALRAAKSAGRDRVAAH
jgi:diguanylate cyclase (GGDEF)-like protein